MEENSTVDAILEGLERTLPPTWPRAKTPALIGGIYAAQTFANADSQGTGPARAVVGRKVIYEKTSFLAWLGARLRPADKKVA